MKSFFRPFATLAAAGLTGGVLASGCVDNKATLFVVGVEQVQPPECELKPDVGAAILLGGVLDVAIRPSYSAGLLVGNQYTPRGDKQNLKTETTRVNLRGAEIELRDSKGDLLPPAGAGCKSEFSVNGTGFVNPNKGEEAGYGVFAAEIIPECMGFALAETIGDRQTTREVVASVRVFGETTGGQDITSGELTFPITICYGCLISYPADAMTVDETTDPPTVTCDRNVDQAPEVRCRPGQDEVVDCRNCNALAACYSPQN